MSSMLLLNVSMIVIKLYVACAIKMYCARYDSPVSIVSVSVYCLLIFVFD